jgi:hypothetical protein
MDTTTTPTPIPIASTPPTSPPAETSTGPSGEGREGVFKLRAADFQSNEVPHYFLTSGSAPPHPSRLPLADFNSKLSYIAIVC